MALSSSTLEYVPAGPTTTWIRSGREGEFADQVARLCPTSQSDAGRARGLSLWRQVWFNAQMQNFALARAATEKMDEADRTEAEAVIGRFETSAASVDENYTVAASDTPPPAVIATLPVSKRHVERAKLTSADDIAELIVDILFKRVYAGEDEAWAEFSKVAYVNQGIVLITIAGLNIREQNHPVIQAFLELHDWQKGDGLGLHIALGLYRRRQSDLKEKR